MDAGSGAAPPVWHGLRLWGGLGLDSTRTQDQQLIDEEIHRLTASLSSAGELGMMLGARARPTRPADISVGARKRTSHGDDDRGVGALLVDHARPCS